MKLIRNIKKWWPILKEDEDWDYRYLLEVMKFKLGNMADYHDKHRYFVGSEEVVRELSEASRLISALIEDDFFDHNILDDKWGPSVMTINNGGAAFSNKHVKTVEDKEQYHEEFLAEIIKEDARRSQTMEDFCTIFKTKLHGWWD